MSVRWKLALISASLTFAILLLFAIGFGAFTARQLHGTFDDDLRASAADLQEKIGVGFSPSGKLRLFSRGRSLAEVAGTGDAAVRVVSATGVAFAESGTPYLGRPRLAGPSDFRGYRVVSRPIFSSVANFPVAYVQYAKPTDSVDATIARLKFFLALGVLTGTGLALLAGLAVARRAMSPIASLTRTAKEIARTRDPGIRLPEPTGEDEVADLTRTLEEMLEALDAARTETEGTLARQREFVADASHELRTPLTSVLSNLELLEARLHGEDAEIAEAALRSSRRMRRLVADLLLLARADTGRPPARQAVDLGGVVHDAAAETAPLAVGHELSLSAEPGNAVEGSADDLHRLALNLIENAIVHTPPGTHVEVTVRHEGGDALLEVADDGPGVPAPLRERIFERFVRGGEVRQRGRAGSGLGLAIVQAVAQTHGGSVTLTASPGGGARFAVRLPLAEREVGVERSAAGASLLRDR